MTKLVRGFTDMMHPTNLAVNGSFIIDQRSSGGILKIGDYVADAWYVSPYNNVDFLQLSRWPDAHLIGLSGYGKKGQFIQLYNKDSGTINGAGEANGADMPSNVITASVYATLVSASVPIKVVVEPRRTTTNRVIIYNRNLYLNRVNEGGKAVFCESSQFYGNSIQSPIINIELLQDGEFNFRLSNFQEIQGAYKNPPPVYTPYDIDLLRCKRYYQSGVSHRDALFPLRDDGVTQSCHIHENFEVAMAGVPSMTINFVGDLITRDLAPSGAYTVEDLNDWDVGVVPYGDKFDISIGRVSRLTTLKPLIEIKWGLNWTAEV